MQKDHRIARRRLLSLVLCGGLVLLQSSCATKMLLDKAEGIPSPTDPQTQPTQPQPAYYLLVPVVLPFDIVAWPFRYAWIHFHH